jgi:hypothetical protein
MPSPLPEGKKTPDHRIRRSNRRLNWFAPSVLVLTTLLMASANIILFWKSLAPFPYSDEWHYISTGQQEGVLSKLLWAFELNGEHRIPIQRVLQKAILEATGYDFRATIVFNIITAAATAILFIAAAKNYRGHSSIFDIIIPVILFSPMAGFAMWGFHLQFLSSVFFFSLITYLASKNKESGFTLALLVNIFLSACGLNGLILSICISPVLLYKAYRSTRSTAKLTITALYLATIGANILTFHMATSSQGEFSIESFISIFSGMVISSLIPESFSQEAWIKALAMSIWGIALTGSLFSLARQRNPDNAMITMMLLAPMLLLLATAYGRSKYLGEWQPGLAMHYGTLSAIIPLAIWTYSSKVNLKLLSIPLGLLFIVAYGKADYSALQWRLEYTKTQEPNVSVIMGKLRDKRVQSDDIVTQHSADFWFTSQETIETMKKKMPIFRGYYQ